jgi:hypothetical protein
MDQDARFHVVTVGWDYSLVEGVCNLISARSEQRFSHIVHPGYTANEWPDRPPADGIHFLRDHIRQLMPTPDHSFLASLEREAVPTIHNMIISDRVVSELRYDDALGYATFLARRLTELFEAIRPDAILASFDALHAGISLAVAKRMNIPWLALHFSSIPAGLTCFCDQLSPAATVLLRQPPAAELRLLAESALHQFESGSIQATAHVAPSAPLIAGTLARIHGSARRSQCPGRDQALLPRRHRAQSAGEDCHPECSP